jgi:hypothetical protein
MKKIKEYLNLISAIYNAWPVVLIIASFIGAAISYLTGIGNRIIAIWLPLWVVVLIFGFSLYPFAKLIQWFFVKRQEPLFLYQNFLWKTGLFSFRYPIPICPRENCGCQVICRPEDKPSVSNSDHPIYGSAVLFPVIKRRYIYECPRHGQLFQLEDSIKDLQEKAWLSRKGKPMKGR